jgi:hypothetical protein
LFCPTIIDEELYDDTIRGFMVMADRRTWDAPIVCTSLRYRLPTRVDEHDALRRQLDTQLDPDGKTATLKWRRVPIDRRRKERHDKAGNVVYDKNGDAVLDPIGDPNYVYNVKRQPLF